MTARNRRQKRRDLFKRDGNKCFYCGRILSYKSSTLDHLVPKLYGGSSELSNFVLACKKCNMKRDTSFTMRHYDKLMITGYWDEQVNDIFR